MMQTIRLADLPADVQEKIAGAQETGEKVLIVAASGAVIGNITAIPERHAAAPRRPSGLIDRGIQIGHGNVQNNVF